MTYGRVLDGILDSLKGGGQKTAKAISKAVGVKNQNRIENDLKRLLYMGLVSSKFKKFMSPAISQMPQRHINKGRLKEVYSITAKGLAAVDGREENKK